MQIFLITVHVIACLFLIVVILLQAGRGGGLSDIAGGSQAQSILGTETNTFMKRLTEIFAVAFLLTSLTLGIISTHRGKSLMEQKRLGQNVQRNAPLPAELQKAIQEAQVPAAGPVATETQSPAPTPPPDLPAKGGPIASQSGKSGGGATEGNAK